MPSAPMTSPNWPPATPTSASSSLRWNPHCIPIDLELKVMRSSDRVSQSQSESTAMTPNRIRIETWTSGLNCSFFGFAGAGKARTADVSNRAESVGSVQDPGGAHGSQRPLRWHATLDQWHSVTPRRYRRGTFGVCSRLSWIAIERK